MSDEVFASHNCTSCPRVINCPGLPTAGFVGRGTVTAKTGKVSDTGGWVGTSQTAGCPNLDAELSYFMVLMKNNLLINISRSAFLNVFSLSPPFTFWGTNTILSTCAEGFCTPSQSPGTSHSISPRPRLLLHVGLSQHFWQQTPCSLREESWQTQFLSCLVSAFIPHLVPNGQFCEGAS